ncbi:hypothetical protein ACSV5M_21005 [Cellvibrio sp. ARAG 10.3]|uniref:hypothetical protein n=1 Tax=Cellvibrio sp. ARAG 10.3 TaxID=3451358 RepID=UPI003F456F18
MLGIIKMKLPSEHNHVVDFEKIKREAFILLNLGYGFMRLRDDDEGDVKYRNEAQLFKSFGDFYSREVSALLTSISISGRMLDDIIIRENRAGSASRWEYEEILGDDVEGNPLPLRSCFNKVIHADHIDHELMQLPEVYLSGKQQSGKEWNARIFILPFCVSVFEWVGRYNA